MDVVNVVVVLDVVIHVSHSAGQPTFTVSNPQFERRSSAQKASSIFPLHRLDVAEVVVVVLALVDDKVVCVLVAVVVWVTVDSVVAVFVTETVVCVAVVFVVL